METKELKLLFAKLDAVIRLLALNVSRESSQRERIRVLWVAGLKPSEIANVLGTTSSTVRVTLSSLRREERVARRTMGDRGGRPWVRGRKLRPS